ncbi:GNAT family N-acetyltransferase [Cohnella sp.]|uniref:GNAT family N-acetyltransferase n=1 Tax=Cohnella sp. TaxID=1883426 RepID=UPI003563E503
MNDKSKYRDLCKKEREIPLFSMDWWLDVTAGSDNWDVSIVERNHEIVASLPYYFYKKIRFDVIHMPKLTPSMGVWIKYPENQKYTTKLSYEKEIFKELIDNLPDFHLFYQHFHWTTTNWMPFHWEGFKQSTDYTYVIENTRDPGEIFAGFRENIRREIRKAEKRLIVTEEDDIHRFYGIHCKTFDRQLMSTPYPVELVERLDEACRSRQCRKIWIARDQTGQAHSAVYVVWDAKTVYYLMGGADAQLRTSGASSLLLWEAIREASRQGKQFDFVGSMFEPIDRFFRGFGAVQKPYMQISKTNGKLMKWSLLVKEGIRLLR